MSTGPGRRALSLAYLCLFSAVAASLLLLGFAVDRAPLVPGWVTGRYQRSMLSALAGFARPVDGLTDQSPEPVAGGVAGESAP